MATWKKKRMAKNKGPPSQFAACRRLFIYKIPLKKRNVEEGISFFPSHNSDVISLPLYRYRAKNIVMWPQSEWFWTSLILLYMDLLIIVHFSSTSLFSSISHEHFFLSIESISESIKRGWGERDDATSEIQSARVEVRISHVFQKMLICFLDCCCCQAEQATRFTYSFSSLLKISSPSTCS